MFLRLTLFSIQCEAVGRAEEEREEFWLRVDRPGLIQLKWYDALVVRNRYSHVVYREERLSADDPPQPENSSNEKRGRVWVEGKPVRTKFIRDDQNSAHANWVNFHEGFREVCGRHLQGARGGTVSEGLGKSRFRRRAR